MGNTCWSQSALGPFAAAVPFLTGREGESGKGKTPLGRASFPQSILVFLFSKAFLFYLGYHKEGGEREVYESMERWRGRVRAFLSMRPRHRRFLSPQGFRGFGISGGVSAAGWLSRGKFRGFRLVVGFVGFLVAFHLRVGT